MAVPDVAALVFDVFGTVVDWRGTIIEEGMAFNAAHGLAVDWARFADAWRGRYRPSMDRVMRGEAPWTTIDALHRVALLELLDEFGVTGLNEPEIDHLNRVWHRLRPWPDAVDGLTRLKRRFVIGTLSNGNMALLVAMAKHAGLPWDVILSAELARAYKPDPRVYRMAADLLNLPPQRVLMVAAHPSDLEAARAASLRTAYVPRPLEFGPDRAPAAAAATDFDIVTADLLDLAGRLES